MHDIIALESKQLWSLYRQCFLTTLFTYFALHMRDNSVNCLTYTIPQSVQNIIHHDMTNAPPHKRTLCMSLLVQTRGLFCRVRSADWPNDDLEEVRLHLVRFLIDIRDDSFRLATLIFDFLQGTRLSAMVGWVDRTTGASANSYCSTEFSLVHPSRLANM